MIDAEFHNTVDDSLLKFAATLSRYRGKQLFYRYGERGTYECPGGRKETGETIEHITCRGLYEEIRVTCFILTPLSTYSVREILEDTNTPVINCGMLYYGDITELRSMPEGYEIARIALFREPPDSWTYPGVQPVLLEYLEVRLLGLG